MPTVKLAKSQQVNVPQVVADLADQFGIRPSDVLECPSCLSLLKKRKIDPDKVSHAILREAAGLWRAGITQSFCMVDTLNEAVLKRMGDDSRVAENGDIRTIKRAPVEKPKTAPKPRKAGVEILGMPATLFISAAGKAGFTVSAIRAALDELGGIGVKDSTIKLSLVSDDLNPPQLTAEQLAELAPFKDAKPEPPKPKAKLEAVVAPLVTSRIFD